MNKLLALCLLLFSGFAFGEVSEVKITSFVRIGGTQIKNPFLGEICGKVTANERALVFVNADPNTKNVGRYSTATDDNGNWCIVVANFTNQVSAEATAFHKHSGPLKVVKSKIKNLK